MANAITRSDSDTFGGRLGRARESLGMDLDSLAAGVGVEMLVMQGWERDQAEPPASELVVLAGLLGVSPAWLIGGYGEDVGGVDLDADGRAAKIDVLRQRRETIDREIARLESLDRGDDR